jgi:hypothetical protein
MQGDYWVAISQGERRNLLNVDNSNELPTHLKTRERPTFKQGYLCGPSLDAIDYYTEKFDEVDELVVKARKVCKFLPTSVGFVTFEETISAVKFCF